MINKSPLQSASPRKDAQLRRKRKRKKEKLKLRALRFPSQTDGRQEIALVLITADCLCSASLSVFVVVSAPSITRLDASSTQVRAQIVRSLFCCDDHRRQALLARTTSDPHSAKANHHGQRK